MKMNLRKVFSIIICSLAVYLFINMFFNYTGISTDICNNFNDKNCLIETAEYVQVTPSMLLSVAFQLNISSNSPALSFANNMWDISRIASIFMVISIVIIITIHLLYIFEVLKEKWVGFINLLLGFVSLYHLTLLFEGFKHIEATRAGLWIGSIVSLGMLVLSILWHFMSTKSFEKKKTFVTKYDSKTGKPMYQDL